VKSLISLNSEAYYLKDFSIKKRSITLESNLFLLSFFITIFLFLVVQILILLNILADYSVFEIVFVLLNAFLIFNNSLILLRFQVSNSILYYTLLSISLNGMLLCSFLTLNIFDFNSVSNLLLIYTLVNLSTFGLLSNFNLRAANWNLLKKMFLYCLKSAPHVLGGLVIMQFARVLYSKNSNALDMASINFAFQFSSILSLITFAFNTYWAPVFYKAMAGNRINSPGHRLILRRISIYLSFLLICALFLSYFAYDLVEIIFGPSYLNAVSLIRVYLVGLYLQAVYFFLYHYFILFDKVIILSNITFFVALSSILITLGFLDVSNVINVPLSFVVTYGVYVICCLPFVIYFTINGNQR